MSENFYFSPTTQEKKVEMNLGNQENIKEYSMWGWFKFKGETSSISNIITLRNIEPFNSTDPSFGPYPNSQYPVCPVTDELLLLQPTLLEEPGIKDNPNCFTQKKNIKKKGPDFLYVNYDLNPANGQGQQTYSLVFLLQTGIAASGNSDMKIEGFLDIPHQSDVWCFFAISLSYLTGQVEIYIKSFNDIKINAKQKSFQIDYPDFNMKKFGQIVFAGVEINPYFQSTSGFIGNIAYIEMGLFFTRQLENLWMNIMFPGDYIFKGIIREFFFEILTKKQKIESGGAQKLKHEISGDFNLLYLIDKNKAGVRFFNGSFMDLGFVDFQHSMDTKSILFYFQLTYQEQQPQKLILLERGEKNVNGYIIIYLLKTSKGRILQMEITNDKSSLIWKSKSFFEEKKKFWFYIGFAISLGNQISVAFYDSNGIVDISMLSENYIFSFSPQKMILMNKLKQGSFEGHVDLERFTIFNNVSGLIYKSLVKGQTNAEMEKLNQQCLMRTSSYLRTYDCTNCQNSVLSKKTRVCVDYCDFNYKNASTNVCVPCVNNKCTEMNTTKWVLMPEGKTKYRFMSSKPLLNKNLDFENILNVQLGSKGPSPEDFQLRVKKDPQNDQQATLDFEFQKPVIQKTMAVKVYENPEIPFFDQQRNRIYSDGASLYIRRICIQSSWKDFIFAFLAYLILVLALLSLIFLIIFNFSRKDFHDLGALWKFWLNIWIKLVMISLLLFVGVYQPCCVEHFLNIIYTYTMKWNYGLRGLIDSIHGSQIYYQLFEQNKLPEQFTDQDLKQPFLHNMGIGFCLHLLFFILYIFLKIWDCLLKKSINIIYKTYVFFEFSFLISGYLFFGPYTWFCIFTNYKYGNFDHSYFNISFIVGLCYFLVFIFSWMYFFVRLIGSNEFFTNPIIYNRYYYFFSAMKNYKGAKSYDLILILFIFIYSIIIALATKNYIVQTILLFLIVLTIIFYLICMRPFKYKLMFWSNLISWILIAIAIVGYIIIAAFDQGNCPECNNKEGFLCWLIVIPLFLAFFILYIGIITLSFQMKLYPERFMNEQIYHQQSLKSDQQDNMSQNFNFASEKNLDLPGYLVKDKSYSEYDTFIRDNSYRQTNALYNTNKLQKNMINIKNEQINNGLYTNDKLQNNMMNINNEYINNGLQQDNFYSQKTMQIDRKNIANNSHLSIDEDNINNSNIQLKKNSINKVNILQDHNNNVIKTEYQYQTQQQTPSEYQINVINQNGETNIGQRQLKNQFTLGEKKMSVQMNLEKDNSMENISINQQACDGLKPDTVEFIEYLESDSNNDYTSLEFKMNDQTSYNKFSTFKSELKSPKNQQITRTEVQQTQTFTNMII